MKNFPSRRDFIRSGSFLAAATAVSFKSFAQTVQQLASDTNIRIGYVAITWNEDHIQFLKDVTPLGFKWIQLRNYLLKSYGVHPEKLAAILKQYDVRLAMYSLGDANIHTGDDKAVLAQLVAQARFVKALGGNYAMVTNTSRPKNGQPPSKEQLITYAKLINELGKQTADLGVTLTYHNHMGQLGETPEEVDIIFENTDEKYIKALLDIGHYTAGGGNCVKFIDKYKERLKCLHIKDVRRPSPDAPNDPASYKFLELGTGSVDIPVVFEALKKINFDGWALVELDYVPNAATTPLQTAITNQKYITEKLKLKI
jgi:inosose dehydratase